MEGDAPWYAMDMEATFNQKFFDSASIIIFLYF